MQGAHSVYKTLGFRWLFQVFCPASAFVSADRNEARSPPLRVASYVGNHKKKFKLPWKSENNVLNLLSK